MGALVDGHGPSALLDGCGVAVLTGASTKPVALVETADPTTRVHLRLKFPGLEPAAMRRALDGVERRGDVAGPVARAPMASRRSQRRVRSAQPTPSPASGSALARCKAARAGVRQLRVETERSGEMASKVLSFREPFLVTPFRFRPSGRGVSECKRGVASDRKSRPANPRVLPIMGDAEIEKVVAKPPS